MSLFGQIARVRAAQARVVAQRAQLAAPAAALLARGRRHPLLVLGAAGGAGFVLGRLHVHPLRLPGLGPLLRGGLADVVAQGARLLAELGAGSIDDASA